MTIEIGAPTKIIRGTTVAWRSRATDYDPATWTLNVGFVAMNDQRSFVATDNGDSSFLITISAAESLEFQADFYRYQELVTDGTDTHLLGAGVINVVENFLQVSSGHDGRSHAARMYDELCKALERKALDDQVAMSSADKSMSRYQWADMLEAKGNYAHQMTDAERIARGFKPRKQKHARFCR